MGSSQKKKKLSKLGRVTKTAYKADGRVRVVFCCFFYLPVSGKEFSPEKTIVSRRIGGRGAAAAEGSANRSRAPLVRHPAPLVTRPDRAAHSPPVTVVAYPPESIQSRRTATARVLSATVRQKRRQERRRISRTKSHKKKTTRTTMPVNLT